MTRKSIRGVTLIELLVVVGIIGILMSLLFPAAAAIRKSGRIRSSQTLVHAVDMSLKLYNGDFDGYPDGVNSSNIAKDDGKLYFALSGPNNRGITDPMTGKHFGPYGEFPPETLKKSGANTLIVDYFGHELYYFNCKSYMDTGGTASNCHNPTTFDLLSTGPNGTVDPFAAMGTPAYDDITNY